MIILKILLYILLAVFGIILLILILPVQAEASFIGGKFSYRLKYAFINIMDSDGGGLLAGLSKGKGKKPKKPVKEKSEDEHAPKAEKPTVKADKEEKSVPAENNDTVRAETDKREASAEEEKSEKPKKNKKSPGEIFELVSGIWYAAKRPLRKILKGFRFTGVYIDFLIADEDAYKCALNYGRISGILYNILAGMSMLFTVKLKTVDVECGFAQEKSRFDAAARLTFVPMTAVIAGLWFLVTYIFRVYLPKKIQTKKQTGNTAKMQKTQPQGGM